MSTVPSEVAVVALASAGTFGIEGISFCSAGTFGIEGISFCSTGAGAIALFCSVTEGVSLFCSSCLAFFIKLATLTIYFVSSRFENVLECYHSSGWFSDCCSCCICQLILIYHSVAICVLDYSRRNSFLDVLSNDAFMDFIIHARIFSRLVCWFAVCIVSVCILVAVYLSEVLYVVISAIQMLQVFV